MLREQRTRLHAACAEALSSLGSAVVDSQTLAMHYENGGDPYLAAKLYYSSAEV